MNGLEKITARIENDARAEINEVLSAAKEKAEEIRLAAEGKTAARLQSGRAQNAAAAESHRARLVSAAGMDGRQKLLAVKQECIDEAFAQALQRLIDLPAEQYAAFLAKWVASVSETGKEALIFSAAARASVGELVVKEANALRTGAAFTLADETREMDGVILQNGNIEINGSLETRLRTLRESMASDVAEILFRD